MKKDLVFIRFELLHFYFTCGHGLIHFFCWFFFFSLFFFPPNFEYDEELTKDLKHYILRVTTDVKENTSTSTTAPCIPASLVLGKPAAVEQGLASAAPEPLQGFCKEANKL